MKKLAPALMCIALVLTFAVSAFADFRFSPDHKFAEPYLEKDANGNEYFGTVIVNGKSTNLPIGQLALSDLQGKSFPDRSTLSASALDILKAADVKLGKAYNQLLETKSLFDVFGKDKLDASKTYIVTKLFDLSPINDGVKTVADAFKAGGVLEVAFKMSIASDEYFFATLCEDDWKVIDTKSVKVEGDKVTVTFDELCPIALIELSSEDVKSPQTSPAFPFIEVAAVVFAAASVACFVIGRKRSRA